ncbi:hypothetical protein PI124_g7882 [Phytophthora idaei]|nr:hypothetical protein PI125_g21913 [Phytophthora idaei]KAG3131713.1 hypothetical protein PI126_g19944 [Phytophthora idaei]KAG3247447.1 hypothetical protein PI124_g7882 [Phytophthora idaei]
MLLSSARRLWRLARPFQEYRGGTSHYRLYARCYSSTISGGGSKLSDRRSSVAFLGGVNNGKRKTESRPMLNAWEKKFLAGLTAYQEKSGNVLVPHAFIVPSGDESWPPTLWGYRLGRAVNVVRTRYKPQEDKKGLSTQMIEELERVGFVQNVPQFKWDHYVLPSLQTFKKLYGNTDVPYYFVVPERDESWPKLAWGKRLGLTVTVMRVGRAYASQMAGSKEELEKLEFCFSTIAERD